MKTYEAIFEEDSENVFSISLVDNPAMESMFIALSKDEIKKEINFAEVDKKERTLLGVALIPDKPIYRNQNGEEFYITFPKETIKASAHNFFTKGFQNNSTIEHETKIEGISFVEAWIVKDPKNDTAIAYGLPKDDIVEGAWVVKMKCDNDEIYQKALDGEVKGFSIDGMFNLKEINLKSEIKMSEIKDTLSNFKDELLIALNLKKEVEDVVVVEVKLGSVKSSDGAIVFEYEGETPEAGVPIWVVAEDGTKVPVPASEYELEDGSVLKVAEEGIIESIMAKEEEPAELDGEPAQPSVDANTVVSQVQEAIKSIMIKYADENKISMDALKSEISELNSKVVELSEQPAASTTKPRPVQVALNKKGRILNQLRNK